GMDHGTDTLGSDTPGEELNLIEKDADYGWPWIVDDGVKNILVEWPPTKSMTFEQYVATVTNPTVLYTPHASPLGLKFYRGEMFPEAYRGGAFVTFRGSWNAYPAVGFEIAFVPFVDAKPSAFQPFVTGFLTDEGTN